jgi:peptidoglycan/LPS O-acetylase OafA/YrhL
MPDRGDSTGSSGTKQPVRRDIEGLRAIAVLAVVLNHVLPSALPGGFAGVDIFFVISGYLIGMHLLEDIQGGKFSFLRFYARRARRILPALAVMLVAVWGLGWVILSGPEFSDLGKHIVAASIFSNNVLLWSQSGYFDAPSATKPLLHLWSLGVEEQFYLVVPFLLWLGSRGRHASIRWVLRVSAVSLVLTVAYAEPSFYLLDTRFWELGAGVAVGYVALHDSSLQRRIKTLDRTSYREILAFVLLLMFITAMVFASKQSPWSLINILETSGLSALFILAIITAQLASAYRQTNALERLMAAWRRHEHSLRNAMAVAGVVLIGVSLVAVTSTDWPGPQTLFPVLSTALVIMAGPAARANGLLACRPLVFVGGISYPLYLWHWPAIVFWKMFALDMSAAGRLIPIGGAFVLAWLTKDFIENPIRFGKLWYWAVPIAPISAVVLGLLITGLLGASAVATNGYPERFPPGLRTIASWSPYEGLTDGWRANRCYFNPGQNEPFAPECTPPKQPGFSQILLWGDSHAAHLYPGLVNLHTRNDFVVVQWTSAGCPPTREPLIGEVGDCARRRVHALHEMNRVAPDTVLLAAAWELYLADGNSEAAILAAVRDDIQWMQHSGIRRIVFFGPGPTWVTSLPVDIFRYMLRKRTEHIPERIGAVSNGVWHLDAAMAAMAATADVKYVSILDRFCDPRGCRTLGDGDGPHPDLLFQDRDHFTESGSRFLMDAAAPQIFALTQ